MSHPAVATAPPVSVVSIRMKQWSPAVTTLTLTSCTHAQQQVDSAQHRDHHCKAA